MLALALGGGVLAGVINTLAGSGSLVTLPLLVMLGLPAPLANGTNRVGIVFQCASGILTMRQQGTLQTQGSGWFIAPTLLGAILGAMIATTLNEQIMNLTLGVLMVIMLAVTLLNPKQWLREESEREPGRPAWWLLGLFFLMGVHGGFLQAGVGVMLLLGLVMGAKFSLVAANGIKLLIALSFSAVALIMFAFNDLVYWPFGLLMAAGQALGAWLAARFLSHSTHAKVWVRRLLIGVIVVGIARFLVWPLL